ncbi:hypothetical protein GIB67_018463 [Kingdonia uniflora]|uniref:AP2/ERF domain-containing protein n=1 Tax=Kingdonia uniflora TaxID=39325 RepID=A0A7J7LJN5_9MAGN|nr:hypothetical protein GIB67_018463 [Kingdonia uniflora]
MGRKRKSIEGSEPKECNDGSMGWDQMVEGELGGLRRARRRFVGVRQRPSGRWVAEIKDTIQKIRVWLGTFDTAEEAARAYDEAACILRCSNTRTNFWPCSQSISTTPALPAKISNLIFHRLKARNKSCSLTPTSLPPNQHYKPDREDSEEASEVLDTQFTDFLIESEDFLNTSGTTNGHMYSTLESSVTKNEDTRRSDVNQSQTSGGGIYNGGSGEGEWEEGEESIPLGIMDFQFMDVLGPYCYYSPFEIAEYIVEQESNGDDPSMLRETMKMMKYERKFSALLYALNGISECSKLQIGSGSLNIIGRSDNSINFRNASNNNQEKKLKGEEAKVQYEEQSQTSTIAWSVPSSSSSSSSIDSESSLWNSLDLQPICFVN